MKYIGIDPGLDGAVALLHTYDMTVEVFDMPTYKMAVNGSEKRHINLPALALLIDTLSVGVRRAIIENPSSSPQMGVTSAFTFGFTCGVAQMAIAANMIPVQLVRPNIWKRALGLSSDKNQSRELATKLFPESAHLWARVKDDGRAESILLAYYGSKLG